MCLSDQDAAATYVTTLETKYKNKVYDVANGSTASETANNRIEHKGIYVFTNKKFPNKVLTHYWDPALYVSVPGKGYSKYMYDAGSPPNVCLAYNSTSDRVRWRMIKTSGGCFNVYPHYYTVNTYCLDQFITSAGSTRNGNAVLFRDTQYRDAPGDEKTQTIRIEYHTDNSISFINDGTALYLTVKTDGIGGGAYADREQGAKGNVFWADKQTRGSSVADEQKWTFENVGTWMIDSSPQTNNATELKIGQYKYAGKGYRKRWEPSTAQINTDASAHYINYLKGKSCPASNNNVTTVYTHSETGLVMLYTPYLPGSIECYVVAMGSYYMPHSKAAKGAMCYVELTNGTKFFTFCGDMKADEHTNDNNLVKHWTLPAVRNTQEAKNKATGDPLHMYTTAGAMDDNYDLADPAYEFCTIEFWLDTRNLQKTWIRDFYTYGGVSRTPKIISDFEGTPYEKFFAEIKMIKRLNFTLFNDEEWYIDYNGSPNYLSTYQDRK